MNCLDYNCEVCSQPILSSSKHCAKCNRCCHKFDHHCMWLNNCIGESNYDTFILTIVTLPIYLIASAWLLLDLKIHVETWALILSFVTMAIVFIADVHLLGCHVYLYSKGITTFAYIAFNKKVNAQKALVKEGKLSQEEFHIWKKDQFNNLERFQPESKIKILISGQQRAKISLK